MANTSNFRNINFVALLYETLTGFLSINKTGTPTWMYKFCAAVLAIFQQPFQDFVTFRNKEYLIANCKWQIGQLTNVLNYLYDPTQKRITITQAIALPQFLMMFDYPPEEYVSDFAMAPMNYWQEFSGTPLTTEVSINVPNDPAIDLADLTATVAQISIEGPKYSIVLV